MEEHDLVAALRQTRARLRALLIPDPATGRIEADVFPRSTVMRFLVAALPIVTMLWWRSRPSRGAAWPRLARSLVQTYARRPRRSGGHHAGP
jgi:hypothetical protein